MSFITKRRLASLASASAIIATMAVAAAPACGHGGAVHPDRVQSATASTSPPPRSAGRSPGRLDATGCDIGVYNPTSVSGADIHGARYYGVVVNGATVNMTNSKVHDIGDSPFNGMQHGRAILYINGASGTISGNQVYDFQKNGIEVSGLDRRWQRSLQPQDLRDGQEQRRHRPGSHRLHRPERHRDQERRERHCEEQHRQQVQLHADRHRGHGPAALSNAGRVTASGNKFAGNEVNIYGGDRQQAAATSSPNSRRSSTDRGLHAEAPVFLRARGDCPAPRPSI